MVERTNPSYCAEKQKHFHNPIFISEENNLLFYGGGTFKNQSRFQNTSNSTRSTGIWRRRVLQLISNPGELSI